MAGAALKALWRSRGQNGKFCSQNTARSLIIEENVSVLDEKSAFFEFRTPRGVWELVISLNNLDRSRKLNLRAFVAAEGWLLIRLEINNSTAGSHECRRRLSLVHEETEHLNCSSYVNDVHGWPGAEHNGPSGV